MGSVSEPSTKRGRLVPDNACPECGTPMRKKHASLKFPVNGEEIGVAESLHLRCPKCPRVVLRFDDARKLRQQALETDRQNYGLLVADDIRSIRGRFGLTESDLARLLRLGANTISRWEAGRNVQTASMDMLFRMIRDLPGSLEYLRGQVPSHFTTSRGDFGRTRGRDARAGVRLSIASRRTGSRASGPEGWRGDFARRCGRRGAKLAGTIRSSGRRQISSKRTSVTGKSVDSRCRR